MKFLNDEIKISRVLNGVAAGTSVQAGSAVDMQGYDGVMFIALLGALTATQVTSMEAHQSSDNAAADAFTALLASKVGPLADGDSNKCLVLDVWRPQERYVKPVINRATANAVIDGVIAIQYKARSLPTAHATSVAFAEKHNAPAEGTA